ncbi:MULTISPECIES: Rieske 2Fe-2S domain-containing protein [Halobellus]|uniref:Rieske (2Fe-2S) protein n=1 Tax=Halobellus TaxID=1073986 RepID=UPI00210EF452|nr:MULTISPECIES: Rieske 2Fe-2S domain-containing protein [Halobellus]MDQ2054547.1 Rieske 2Fe-2S domain-containing protein [Halobellus sp. H-GB7]
MSDLVEVKPADEFENGDREFVDVGGVEVGVLQVEDEFYALQNYCMHDGGPVCSGKTHRKLLGEFKEPGQRVEKSYSEDECVISCPWHGWSYDIESGDHLANDDISLPTYEVVVEDGVVYVGGQKN